MPLNFKQHLQQKLTLSTKMKQSLSLLSLSHEDLNQAIQQELSENPLLETVETQDSFSFENKKFEISKTHDFFSSPHRGYYGEISNRKNPIEDYLSEQISLKSYVLKQAETSFFKKEIKLILPLLISYLDEKAYLNVNLEDLSIKEQIPLNHLEEALFALQSLEPIGLGGRNLQECLLIQLRHKTEDTQKASSIVRNHLQNLKDKKYMVIAYDLNISLEETIRLCNIIRSLEPNPARNFSSQPTVLVCPDLYIYKQGEDYHVILNTDFIPELKFSHEYVKNIRKSSQLNFQEKKYIYDKTNSARWFIYAIRQRQVKIKKIADYLIEHQKDFFDKGKSYLKPLTMQDMAHDLGVHISTISRIINNKYAYTPQGMMALKQFFEKGLMTKTGNLVSVTKIKKSIKQYIKTEDPSHPLSDQQICEKLHKKFRVSLLRRSISQYRSGMDIPSAEIRARKSQA